MKFIFVASFILLFICDFTFANDFNNNLINSGKNRTELDKVLEYYKKKPEDRLKLKAAQFLIENMDAHSFFQSKSLDSYFSALDTIFKLNRSIDPINKQQDSLLKTLPELDFIHEIEMPDLKYVSANFLIENIDKSFEAWKSPWARNLSFENFCEYLLPYRVVDEKPVSWRKAFYDNINPLIVDIMDFNSCNRDLSVHFSFDKYIKSSSVMCQDVALSGKSCFDKGLIGTAIRFNGIDNFISYKINDISKKREMSISAWLNQDETRESSRLFEFGQDTLSYMYFTPCSSKGISSFVFKNDGEKEIVLSYIKLPVNKWVHVAITIADEIVILYINGKQVSRRSLPKGSYTPGHYNSCLIGKSLSSNSPLFKGMIDDFRVYNRALHISEIESIVGIGLNSRLQDLVTTISQQYSIKVIYDPIYFGGFSAPLLLNMKLGSCYNYSTLGTYFYRSLGIASTIDYTPQWANGRSGHGWNVLFCQNGKALDYSFSAKNDTLGMHIQKRITDWENVIPKIYREMFSKQPTALGNNKGNEDVPSELDYTCIKDVTDAYIITSDPVIAIEDTIVSKGKNLAYLCCFNNSEWKPVHWGKIDRQQVVSKMSFTKMGRGAIYLPMIYRNERMIGVSSPFLLTDSGSIISYKPDLSNLQSILLSRKCPLPIRFSNFAEAMINGKFQVANNADFSDSITVYTISSTPNICYKDIPISLDKPYRYFRFYSSSPKGSNIAEIEIFGADLLNKLNGTVIGNYFPKRNGNENVFDSDVLSYYEYYGRKQGWVGLDLGKPTTIKSFRYLPRNDDNFIRENQIYELFYWDRHWVSLGVKTGGKDGFLDFDKVPRNALFWLHNKSAGIEERIFTYENDQQVWW